MPESSEPLELANEFAEVSVRKVATRNGVRLEIVAPKLGRGIRLCPLELESLTWQSPETFSGFLSTPFGPEAESETRSLTRGGSDVPPAADHRGGPE